MSPVAKEAGMGQATLSIDDGAGALQVVKNDITNYSLATPRGVQDVTGIDKSAMERLLLLADASFEPTFVFNDQATTGIHQVLKTVSSTSTVRTVSFDISGQTLSLEMLFSDYNLQRAQSGELTGTAPSVLANGAVPTWS